MKVEYAGEPKFEPIKGTSMEYATNTADKVIELEGTYYLCLQGVWFMAPTPTGQWTTCMSVPQEIYTIPSSSPVYNVTYVTQTANPDGTVTSSYTAGYLGTFILGAATGAILADGSGYWWPPYCNGGYYYPYPATYCGAYYGVMVIIIQRLTMTLLRELMAGNGLPMALTDRRHGALVTILTPGLMREVLRFRHLMAAEAQHKHITHTPAPMRRRDKVRVPNSSMGQLLRVARKPERYHGPLLDGQWNSGGRRRFAGRKSGRFQHEVGKFRRLGKLPAATCMPGTMATFTRTQVTAGRSTIMEAGTQ